MSERRVDIRRNTTTYTIPVGNLVNFTSGRGCRTGWRIVQVIKNVHLIWNQFSGAEKILLENVYKTKGEEIYDYKWIKIHYNILFDSTDQYYIPQNVELNLENENENTNTNDEEMKDSNEMNENENEYTNTNDEEMKDINEMNENENEHTNTNDEEMKDINEMNENDNKNEEEMKNMNEMSEDENDEITNMEID